MENLTEVRMNRRMEGIYRKVEADLAAGTEFLNRKLADLIGGGIVRQSGAYLLRAQKTLVKSGASGFQDLTGYECFVNHIHVEDYVETGGHPLSSLKQGILFGRRILEKLKTSFPQKPFTVIVSLSESGCTIRFHSTRRAESWLSDDLEGYREEAILVLEI